MCEEIEGWVQYVLFFLLYLDFFLNKKNYCPLQSLALFFKELVPHVVIIITTMAQRAFVSKCSIFI